MKVAQLPDGRTLEFPLHTPEDAIDETVKKHLEEHTGAIEQKKQEKIELANRHSELTNGIMILAKLMYENNELLKQMMAMHKQGHGELLLNDTKGHDRITKSIDELAKIQSRKKRIVRDKEGRAIGAESV